MLQIRTIYRYNSCNLKCEINVKNTLTINQIRNYLGGFVIRDLGFVIRQFYTRNREIMLVSRLPNPKFRIPPK